MEGIYVVEVSTGCLKIGRSTDLLGRIRQHERAVELGGGSVLQVWTCNVAESQQAERHILDVLGQLSHVELVGGRETFRGLPFFEAIALARDICSDYSPAAVRPIPDREPPRVLVDLLAIMRAEQVDRMRSEQIHERLGDGLEGRAVWQQLSATGLRTRRWRPATNANPVRGYFLDDVESILDRYRQSA